MFLAIKNKFTVFFCMLLTVSISLKSQTLPNDDIVQYISQYADIAIKEMVRTRVPASIKIAQGILETQAGKSDLVLASNNHFGIKCKSNWNGPKVYHDDDAQNECFRKYKDAQSSYKDHSDFLKSQPRYSPLFDLDPDDYSGWAWGLKKAGYATNPVYAETIIKYVENYQLNILNDYASDDEQESYDISKYINEITKNGITTSKSSPRFNELSLTKQLSYPSGIFTINGTRVVFAESGTSLLSLARKYKLALSKIILYNDLPKSTTSLKKSELIYLQPKKSVGNKTYHRVVRNENLRDISQHEGIKLTSLIQYNKLKNNSKLKVGQKLSLKPKKGKTITSKKNQPKKKKSSKKKSSKRK